MARELTIIFDDKLKSVGLRGKEQFSILELFGIAEHLKLWATMEDGAQIQMALAQSLSNKIELAQAVGVDKRWPKH